MPVPTTSAETQRTLLRHVVQERLRTAIMDGTLVPGEDLHDKELQEWLGVSRTPIRDALNELTRMGLVEMSPNRYTRVATPHEEEALASMQTLGVLLGGIVRLAVPLLTDVQRTEMLADVRYVTHAMFEGGDIEKGREKAFHMWERFAKLTGNAQLEQVYSDVSSGLFHKVPAAFFVRMFDQEEIEAHFRTLAAAIADADAIAAELAAEAIFQLPHA